MTKFRSFADSVFSGACKKTF